MPPRPSSRSCSSPWRGSAWTRSEASPYLLQLFGRIAGPRAARRESGAHEGPDLRCHPAGDRSAASRLRPCVLVLEDLHWIDRTSDELLALLIDSVPAAAILLVATYRPGYQPPWLPRSYVTQVALAPLSREDSRTVLGSALGRAPVRSRGGRRHRGQGRGQPVLPGGAGPSRRRGGRARRRRRARHHPERAHGAHRSAGRRGPAPPAGRRGHRPGRAASRSSRPSPPRARPSCTGSLRRLQAAEFLDEARPAPQPRIHVQARADPRGGLRQRAARAAARAPRPGGPGAAEPRRPTRRSAGPRSSRAT